MIRKRVIVKVYSNKSVRFLTLKRHIKFVWNCAVGKVQITNRFGKLTLHDYIPLYSANWGKDKEGAEVWKNT